MMFLVSLFLCFSMLFCSPALAVEDVASDTTPSVESQPDFGATSDYSTVLDDIRDSLAPAPVRVDDVLSSFVDSDGLSFVGEFVAVPAGAGLLAGLFMFLLNSGWKTFQRLFGDVVS